MQMPLLLAEIGRNLYAGAQGSGTHYVRKETVAKIPSNICPKFKPGFRALRQNRAHSFLETTPLPSKTQMIIKQTR